MGKRSQGKGSPSKMADYSPTLERDAASEAKYKRKSSVAHIFDAISALIWLLRL
jgi:hypothetical protein